MRKKEFLETVENFLLRHNMSPTTFGIKSTAEPSLVFDLRKGRECREEKQDKILSFITANDNAEPDDKGAA